MSSGSPNSLQEFSEWFYSEVSAHYANETEAWALQRVRRVQDRINAGRRAMKPLDCSILWIPSPTAFTLYGSHVYISRRLLERLPSDEMVAFVLAHEAAHHDLGHLDQFAGWAKWVPQTDASLYVATVARLIERNTYGPERENDADDYALRLCNRVGYKLDLVVEALVILENIALDNGDIAGVYGPENLLDPTDPHAGSTAYRVQEWIWTRLYGYHPLRVRRTRARALADSLKAGKR